MLPGEGAFMLCRLLSFVSGVVETGVSRLSRFATLAFTGSLLGLALPAVIGIAFCTTANAAPGPVITVPPVSQSMTLGNPATFSVAASGPPTLTYQWQFSTNGTTWSNWLSTPGTSASMTTPAVPAGANGWEFRVVITDGNSLSKTSSPVTLTVNSPPVITVPPVSQSVTLGNPATFSVAASGTPTLTYQWQFSTNGTPWSNWLSTPGTSASMTTPAVPAGANGWEFRVVVTDGNSLSKTSSPVTLTVKIGRAQG